MYSSGLASVNVNKSLRLKKARAICLPQPSRPAVTRSPKAYNFAAVKASRTWGRTILTVGLIVVAGPNPTALAQVFPSEPVSFGGGRLTLGGGIAASFSCARTNTPGEGAACAEDTGFFNYTDYEHSALRMMRVYLTGSLKAGERLTLLGELSSENIETIQPYALYLRIKPWSTRAFAMQVGRVPPVFGAFTRRPYPSDNLLIGYPLAYQYLTSLRADALPATADELLRMRGRGWLSSFSLGNTNPEHGVPLVSAARWDTGIEGQVAHELFDIAVSVTNGTLANPLVEDDNGGKQVAGRVAFHPVPGLIAGVSGARGAFFGRWVSGDTGVDASSEYAQTAWGADVEYSLAYFLVRFETIVSDWGLPSIGPPTIDEPLRAVSSFVEGRYKIRPGLYAAARLDHLGFSEITGTGRRDNWDAPLTRIEIGGGYSLQRNLMIKLSVQQNTRETTSRSKATIGAAQVVFWF